MIGPMQKDLWLDNREQHGNLNQEWFSTTPAWSQQHIDNISRTFRLNYSEHGEYYHWTPLDAWVWHENVVLFSGIWTALDNKKIPHSCFDATYLSMPSSATSSIGRDDLVIIDSLVTGVGIPEWYEKPLSHGAAPLWWRLNKDLQWAKRFIDFLSDKTTRVQWDELGLSTELCRTIPMFERAWAVMKTQSDDKLEVPEELPAPAWALDEDSEET